MVRALANVEALPKQPFRVSEANTSHPHIKALCVIAEPFILILKIILPHHSPTFE